MWLFAASVLVTLTGSQVEVRGREGRGSGVRISAAHVLTNAHVVENESTIVVVCNGAQVAAHVVATEEGVDLALLEIVSPARCTASIANFRSLGALPGEPIVARGCPFGNCQKQSRGEVIARWIIEGHERLVSRLYIRPGSSGGPVYDDEGFVIGVTRAYALDADDERISYGMLIPADQAIAFVLRSCRMAMGTTLTLRVGGVAGVHHCPGPGVVSAYLFETR